MNKRLIALTTGLLVLGGAFLYWGSPRKQGRPAAATSAVAAPSVAATDSGQRAPTEPTAKAKSPEHSVLWRALTSESAAPVSGILDGAQAQTVLPTLAKGDRIQFVLPRKGLVTGVVNLNMVDTGNIRRVAGSLDGQGQGGFSFVLAQGSFSGRVLLPDEALAYRITAIADNQSKIEATPLDKVLCFRMPAAEQETASAEITKSIQEAVPVLSSRPTATAVLYLDFDGETVTDPDWNNGNTIVAAPCTLGSSDITTVWKRVSEDYAAFNIDVTTDVTRYNNAPVNKRTRCIITPTSSWYGSAGGVAYLDSFAYAGQSPGFSSTIPCWVFNTSVTAIAEAAAHEPGHTLGLYHDGRTSPAEEYYEGQGSWAPIMGVGYYKTIVQWSKGEYLNANNTEDDIAIIAGTTNGFGFASDEAGGTIATAVPLTIANSAFSQAGVISSSADIDVYSLTVSACSITINANPATVSPDLDISLELLDSSGNVLISSSQDTTLTATIAYGLPAGTYYLRIKGTGQGDPLTTGYTSYGSIGQYTLTGTIGSPQTPPTISTQPTGVTSYVSNSIYLSVYATGTGTLAYQWQKDGVNLTNGTRVSGATSSSLTITSSQTSDAGQYRVIVTNWGGSVTSNAVTVTINIPPAPVFTTQPSSATVFEGASLSLYGSVSSPTSVSYQWYKNGAAINGSTYYTFSKSYALLSDAGTYKLAATNAGGTTFSNDAVVTVSPATMPVFTVQPQSQGCYVGTTSVTFRAYAVASPTPSYQWYKNGISISGETYTTLTVYALSLSKNGDVYTVKATTAAGTTTSNPATLGVYAVNSGHTLNIAPATRTVGCGRVVYPITVSSNTDWTVSKSASWVSVSPTSGTFERSLEVIVAPNPLTTDRTATITIGQATHTLTQRAAGTPIRELWAVGANDFGQLGDYRIPTLVYPAQTDSSVKAVACGYYHTLYVKTDGSLWATGANDYGSLGDGSYTYRYAPVQIASNVQSVACGSGHTLFVKTDGSLWATGDNIYGQLGNGTNTTRSSPVQIATAVQSVACGSGHTLFVKTDGSLWAMGYNSSGQLGDGTTTTRYTPVQIATAVQSVACGSSHTLFVKTDGSLWAMGYNSYGQLGDGSSSYYRTSPVQITTAVQSVACGSNNTLFVKTDGTLWAMGYNYGQLGDGTTTTRYTPVQIATAAQSVACGLYNTLFVKTDDTLWGTGANNYGQLGDGTTTTRYTPVQIATAVQSVSCGLGHTLFVRNDGTLWAMGSNAYGQLGAVNTAFTMRSVPVSIDSDAVSASGGEDHTLFVRSDSSAWSMGYNGPGQLGDGTATDRYWPSQVLTGIQSSTSGYDHSFLLKSDGTLLAAGYNSFGQLGDGTTSNRTPFSQTLTGIAASNAGSNFSLFLKTDSTLWAAGDNGYGQYGNGTTISLSSPVQVASSVKTAAAGYAHSLVIKSDDTLWTAGDNSSGQLGDGTFTQRTTPYQISGSYKAAAAGRGHSLLLKTDGTAWATGSNSYGQLGNGSTTSRTTAAQVLTNVQALAAGQYHSLFLKTDNTLWTAGDNSSGQLGDGTFTQRTTPVAVAASVQSIAAGGAHTLFIANGDIRLSVPAAPTISSFTPSDLTLSTTVVITGTNFANIGEVYFNGTPASSFTVNSSTQITAQAPSSTYSAGKIVVNSYNGSATSTASFTVTLPVTPASSSASSSSGGGGGGGGAPGVFFFAALGAAGLARRLFIWARRA